jgi:RimJ/RimL family protein N-acetyltransferase
MKTINLRPLKLDRDFGQLAELFTLEQNEPTSEAALRADYKEHKDRIFHIMVAEDEQGQIVGFNWGTRSRFDFNQAYFYIIVKPEFRKQGIGRRLYEDLDLAAKKKHIKKLQITVRDSTSACQEFAERRGFSEKSHYIGLAVKLDSFDDNDKDNLIARLKGEGIQFTSMEALGNTEEMQRKLYQLNDTTDMERILPEGEHSWLSFDEFRTQVCQANWYLPAGQIIAIDTSTNTWAAMSAITQFEGHDHAYNLHTGVNKRYFGRKLAQATLVLALRYARDELKLKRAHTEENSVNLPSFAIYRELGYKRIPGTVSMEKTFK